MTANVIGVIENHAATRHLPATLEVRDGCVQADPAQGRAAAGPGGAPSRDRQGRERLRAEFGFDAACGVATTVAHDCHHLLVTGTSAASMAQAVNTLVDAGGGVAVVRDGTLTAPIELPIGGLMSDEPPAWSPASPPG